MKLLDKVRLLVDREKYNKENIFKGMIGVIINAEIRDNEFLVIFPNDDIKIGDAISGVKIKDLELVEVRDATDEMILEDIPLHNPQWWCKVENGYIINLLGDRKNKIPYDYDS